MSYTIGSNQIMRVASEGANYGTAVNTPTWLVLGLTTDGEIGAKTNINKIYGIGQAGFQAKYAGPVDNNIRCTLVSPTAAVMKYATTRTLGLLESFNVIAGDGVNGAWVGYGLKFDSLDIEVDMEKPLQATMSGIFKTLTEFSAADTEAPVEGDTEPAHLWQPQGLALTQSIGGGSPDTLALVSAVRVNIKNNLSVQNTISPDRTLSILKEGNFEVDVTLQTYDNEYVEAIDLEDIAFACAGSDVELVMTFTDVCDTSTTPATLTVTCSDGTFLEKRQPIKANEYAEYSVGMTFDTVDIT